MGKAMELIKNLEADIKDFDFEDINEPYNDRSNFDHRKLIRDLFGGGNVGCKFAGDKLIVSYPKIVNFDNEISRLFRRFSARHKKGLLMVFEMEGKIFCVFYINKEKPDV